jgi:peptidoglycan hydrolase CwlO-like protein
MILSSYPPARYKLWLFKNKLYHMTVSEWNLLIGTALAGIASLITLYLNLRSKNRIDENTEIAVQHSEDIKALQEAVKTYQIIIDEKDKLIAQYKKELDEVLLKYDKLHAINETLTAKIESLNKRIIELEK